MRNIYRAAERDGREKVNIGSRKTVRVVAHGTRCRKSRGSTERTRCLGCGHLCQNKVDCPNRDTTNTGSGAGTMGVSHKKAAGDDGSGRCCSFRKTKTQSDTECFKQRMSTEVAQTNTAVANASVVDATVGSARNTNHENDHYL